MITTIKQGMELLGRERQSRWVLLVGLALVVSGFEMLGAALVYVLIGLVVDPSGEIEMPIVGDIRALAGDLDEQTLLVGLIVFMGVFFVVRGVVRVANTYAQRRIAENAGAVLSNRLVAGYLRLPYQAHLQRNSSEFIRNSLSAVNELVRNVLIPMIQVVAEALVVVAMLAVVFVVAPTATTLAIVVIGGIAALALVAVQSRFKAVGRLAHRMHRQTLQTLQQTLYGLRDIRILGRESYFARRYSRSRLSLARANYMRSTLKEVPRTVIELAVLGFILLFFGIVMVSGQSVEGTFPVLGLFAYLGIRIQPSVQKIIGGLNDLRYSTAPLEDLYADMRMVETAPLDERPATPLSLTRELVMDNVDFCYEGSERNALSGVNLTIEAGSQVGICGPTGGGKTTLVDLIAGLIHPTSGRVTVDGVDLRDNPRGWHLNLGMVSQMVFLIDDTLRRNVALGVPDNEIDREALEEAIHIAQLSEFVASLPGGLDTTVGELGSRISGGERQRIAIARALYRRPSVLIFDEGTSALDNATERKLMAAIDRLRGRLTVVLVAHRLSTVRKSDCVVFVDYGRIAGLGTFESLQRSNERFRTLAQTK